ncbi:hypothetical protein AA101099_1126 [Neoasaia chiangmaiensis NBRC 101099]|nr:hypothetical protein AA101099_1126 [Neoasaia chiangmaiensis NBRC 101099]GEN15957.1 hypothetical protein NCH01_23880 [Neoasaia chiangmaiensis]
MQKSADAVAMPDGGDLNSRRDEVDEGSKGACPDSHCDILGGGGERACIIGLRSLGAGKEDRNVAGFPERQRKAYALSCPPDPFVVEKHPWRRNDEISPPGPAAPMCSAIIQRCMCRPQFSLTEMKRILQLALREPPERRVKGNDENDQAGQVPTPPFPLS